LLQRVDDRSSSSRPLPADGRLVCYYNSVKFHYLYVSRDETGKHLRVMSALPDQVSADAFTPPIPIPSDVPIELRVEVDYERLRFAYRMERRRGSGCRSSSTRASCRTRRARRELPNFTGAFVGMACQDLAGTAMPADFDWFEYRERDYVADVAHLLIEDDSARVR
jgi:xylan 1,4-beta-xylosidase